MGLPLTHLLPTSFPDLPPGWYSPASRVPRRGQVVRILTRHGAGHQAEFVVSHTDAWPSGAAWSIQNGRELLQFAEVELWAPDPDMLPPHVAPSVESPSPAPEPQASTPLSSLARPAIASEVLVEMDRTGTVLRLLPEDQLDWSPQPTIPSLRTLSWRLVRIVARIGWILDLNEVELLFEPDLPDLQTPEEILETYGANETSVREVAVQLDAAALRAPWVLERNGEIVAQLPRGDALRTFGLTPLVYHRGELALLLTALGIEVPHPYPLWAFAEAAPLPPPGA